MSKQEPSGDDSKRERLVSLDLLRGLTVLGMILVNEMAGMEGPVYPMLLHSHWDGLTLADVVFPSFLVMVGASIALSLSRFAETRPIPQHVYSQILWRTFRLLLFGLFISNFWWLIDFHTNMWRLFGVLQRIGLVYLACALMFLWLRPRTRLIIAGAILLLYWPLTYIPTLDGVPTDLSVRGHNFVGSVDRVLLADHNYVKGPFGYDPEGLLGTLPAIAQGLIGVAIGEYLLRPGEVRNRLPRLALIGGAMLVVGIGWGFVFPVVKDIWSSSFVLVTSGIATIALSGLSWLFDGRPISGARRIVALVLLPFGLNAIAAYVLHEVTGTMIAWDVLQQPYQQLKPVIGAPAAAFVPVGLFIVFVWACMFYLWRKKWIIRI